MFRWLKFSNWAAINSVIHKDTENNPLTNFTERSSVAGKAAAGVTINFIGTTGSILTGRTRTLIDV